MLKKFWRITIHSEFSAAHALRNYNGKCEHLHGHNFGVSITIQGEKLSEDTELLLDFTVLKQELKSVLELLDHKDLNAVSPFDKINPSSENIARFVFQALAPRLTKYAVTLYEVNISERGPQSASYFEVFE
ncbi:6-carboxytetrahydropterin synthase QueD [Desulfovibrio litoralis]|uniref:6-carboxy-5,6,7,8-tetrahydropterin synthase n=1 Tax=Desulfovibrio litoralis DSM 11393 TaxID=1121455 RepID=A0A1M7TAA6_9BACT|nr:6-carboxytetrahydropterin synthase QueD [Desulfovibrio litoralis]SHN67655.1 6-pyruvoyltetrahydropterin/6-carboxytetrahydropterin synthase [Desulfovibrio litoralis DSM 11393]